MSDSPVWLTFLPLFFSGQIWNSFSWIIPRQMYWWSGTKYSSFKFGYGANWSIKEKIYERMSTFLYEICSKFKLSPYKLLWFVSGFRPSEYVLIIEIFYAKNGAQSKSIQYPFEGRAVKNPGLKYNTSYDTIRKLSFRQKTWIVLKKKIRF